MVEQGIITRYSASAGSGKTYKLAGIYLDLLFVSPYNYRHILAVTFTNKAAAEMKERILTTLFQLATGGNSDYLEDLLETTGKDRDWITRRASAILNNVLHDYSMFSVGTIDSFFQKVLRAFVKESGLHAGFNLILDNTVILSEAVDDMLMSVDDDEGLKRWLIEYSQYEISEGNHWNLKGRIAELGKEIFKEEYRLLNNEGKIVSDKTVLREGLSKLISMEKSFSRSLAEKAQQAIEILNNSEVDISELRGKNRSFLKFLNDCMEGVPDALSAAINNAWKDELYYSGKKAPASVEKALASGLHLAISDICLHYEANIRNYKSSKLVSGNLFNLGILTDISGKIRTILNDSNKFLLSDAGDLLGQIISRDQTPFIYEKVGTRYNNFMIDEFQDTSEIQWRNFYPLINNSIAEGNSNLVVGDIKQAIYRWRNSDWRILDGIDSKFDEESFKTDTLNSNWRSASNIIEFNNRLFSKMPGLIEEKLELDDDTISRVYSETEQADPGRKKGGFVRIKEIGPWDERHQKQVVLDELPGLIEEIQDNGYRAGDIGILVRKNSEGQEIISRLMDYASKQDDNRKEKYTYQVISQDSLFLVNSPIVQFIVSSLEYIVDRSDTLSYASMVHFLSLLKSKTPESGVRPDLLDSSIINPDFEAYISTIRYMPVFDIVDRLIDYFDLGEIESGVPFLNTLQDLVLDLSSTETNDIPFFLEWWHTEGYKKSVASPEQSDSIQLMTIHKSKGLQFKVVIIPFLSWSLGHGKNPVIWVYSEMEPFRDLGAVPVKYKKEISETHFKKYYDKEKLNVAIDKLNLLYVALTRSEECLYCYIPVSQRRDSSIGTMVIDALSDGDKEYTFGDTPLKAEIPDSTVDGISVPIPYNTTISEERLRLKINSKDYFARDDEGNTKLSYGLLMHDILSRIDSASDLDAALSYSLNRGEISMEQRNELAERLKKRFENPVVKEWFSEEYISWRERDILLPGGDQRRPDRVVVMSNRAIVIDFKFGAEQSSHITQVKEYMQLVSKIVDVDVVGAVWYLDSDKIVEINTR